MNINDRIEDLSITARVTRAVTSAALIGLTMAQTTPLGWLSVLPLLAVYPAFGAITGVSPTRHLARALRGKAHGLAKAHRDVLPATLSQ